jgi:hypothetical protein
MNDRTPEPADAGDPDRFAPRAAGAMAGPAGTDLTGWSLVLYNGATSLVYGTVPLGGIVPDLQNGVGVLPARRCEASGDTLRHSFATHVLRLPRKPANSGNTLCRHGLHARGREALQSSSTSLLFRVTPSASSWRK